MNTKDNCVHHVLVVVQKPDEKPGETWNMWKALKDRLPNNEKDGQIADNVWRFSVPTQLLSAYGAFAAAKEQGRDAKLFWITDGECQECGGILNFPHPDQTNP